jgi:diguanylate cyclase (GGDEF)-like protein/PAS domain S-box-containing protein
LTTETNSSDPPRYPNLSAPLSFEALGRIFDKNLGAIISIIDLDTRLIYVNERFAKSFEMTPTEMVGKTLFDLYDATHINGFMPYVHRAFAGEYVTYERLGRVVGSTGVWHTVAVAPLFGPEGKVMGAISSSMRVHELKVTVEALRSANERLSSHMDNSPLVVIELDDQLCVTRCSAHIADMVGLDANAIVGQALLGVLAAGEEDITPLSGAFERLRTAGETRNRVEVALRHQSGKTVHSEWFNSALTDATGKVHSMMCLVHDTTARTLAEAQLRQIATHDPLTGLRNRRALAERLEQALARVERSAGILALLFVDLDGFKLVNDEYGHGAGDEVLCEVARRLLLATRQTDVVARVGGDEFVVLIETDVSTDFVEVMCTRIMQSLRMPCPFARGTAHIGASIGVAVCPPAVMDAVELMRRADAAMYTAKRAGKGRVHYAVATADAHPSTN